MLSEKIREVLNQHCAENESNTPDYILAGTIMKVIDALNVAINERDKFYGINPSPGITSIDDKNDKNLIIKAQECLIRVCQEQRFKLTAMVPARPGVDDDLVIGDGLFAGIRIAERIVQMRVDSLELRAVMESVDKWLDDEDDLRQNPATRAARAREIALKYYEKENDKNRCLINALRHLVHSFDTSASRESIAASARAILATYGEMS